MTSVTITLTANWVLFHSKKHSRLLLGTDVLPDPQLPDQSGMGLKFIVLFIHYLAEQVFTKFFSIPQRVLEAGAIAAQMEFLFLITSGSGGKK